MNIELCEKFVADKNFINFCNIIDAFSVEGENLTRLAIASLLLDTNVDFVKGNDFYMLNVVVEKFLSHSRSFKMSKFHDFFIASLILNEAYDYEFNKIMIISHYIGNITNCTCGYTPVIDTKKIGNALCGHILCKKCGLSVMRILTRKSLYWDSPFACWEVESGIKEMLFLWNQEINKKEDIVHRTIRELLEYVPVAGINSEKVKLSDRLRKYASKKIENQYFLECDILADLLMECKEPIQWVEEYLWETQPCRIR